jgi:hypothetical protein
MFKLNPELNHDLQAIDNENQHIYNACSIITTIHMEFMRIYSSNFVHSLTIYSIQNAIFSSNKLKAQAEHII